MKETFFWSFPGGVWMLALVLLFSLGVVMIGYGFTWRPLKSPVRWLLTALRILLIVILLGCLASPRDVMIRHVTHDIRQPVAILVDSSGSMVRPDRQGMTRLGIAEQALSSFWNPAGTLKLFTFSDQLKPLSSPTDLNQFSDPEQETHLLGNLRNVLNAAPPGGWGSVLVFTDGNDTTEEDIESTGAMFKNNNTPLILVATQTDLHSAEFIHISRVKLEPVNVVNTQFPLDVFLQSAVTMPQTVSIRILQNKVQVAEQQLTITPGPHTQRARFNFKPSASGEQDYEIQVLNQATNEPLDSFFASTEIVDRPMLSVLYYSGSLSVEYRYICAAFSADPAIQVESLLYFTPNEYRDQVSLGDTTKIQNGRFPESAKVLNQYSAVILADLDPSQLNPQQTAALLQYVKGGGGLVFMISDNGAARDFAGSDLEQLLPVLFPPKEKADQVNPDGNDEAERLKEQLAKADSSTSDPNAPALDQKHLHPMKITPDGLDILGRLGDQAEENTPLFGEYATISQAKPGSIIAAESLSTNNNPVQPMLTLQHFGEGRSAVLATDSLWSWQMTLPSTSGAYKKLWQQLLFWVANQHGEQPDVTPLRSLVKQGDRVPVAIKFPSRVQMAPSSPPSLTISSPDRPPENVKVEQGTDAHVYTALVPASQAPWMRLQVQNPKGPPGLATLNVKESLAGLEDEHLAPDLSLLQRLAKAAGGQVIAPETLNPGVLVSNQVSEDVVAERKITDLWDDPYVFATLISLFCVELLLRRWQKLL